MAGRPIALSFFFSMSTSVLSTLPPGVAQQKRRLWLGGVATLHHLQDCPCLITGVSVTPSTARDECSVNISCGGFLLFLNDFLSKVTHTQKENSLGFFLMFLF